jgi:hypothetical protein
VEIKSTSDSDFVEDPPLDAQRSGSEHPLFKPDIVFPYEPPNKWILVLGQITMHASQIMSQQFRTFCYTLFIFGKHVRIMRWDRSGCIITRAFDYTTSTGSLYLCTFLWRYNHASLAQRGFDLSHVDASPEEEVEFKWVIEDNIRLQLLDGREPPKEIKAEDIAKHFVAGRVSKMRLFNDTDDEAQEYLVSVPVQSPENVNGRGTRGYWAARKNKEGKWVIGFLKDVWHTDVDGLSNEGRNYDAIDGTPCVPHICGYGDVRVPEGQEAIAWEGEAECNECKRAFGVA